MPRRDRTGERLVSLFLAGAALLVPPLLLVFDKPVRVLGIPVLYLYLFSLWLLLITLAALVAGRTAAPDFRAREVPRDDAVRSAGPRPDGGSDA